MTSSRSIGSVIGSGLLASLLVLVVPGAAHANPVEQPPSATVQFKDLNLDSRADTARLYRRLQSAAAEVCKQTAPVGTLVASRAHYLCIRSAMAGAVRAVDSPALTAYYAQYDSQAVHDVQVVNAVSR
jgi:UrcA family protein